MSEEKYEAKGSSVFHGGRCLAIFDTDVDTETNNEKRALKFVRAVNSHHILEAALKASSEAMLALLDAVRKEPAMQKREYIPLGIQCTNAAEKVQAALASLKAE
jgi:hypothetical protein